MRSFPAALHTWRASGFLDRLQHGGLALDLFVVTASTPSYALWRPLLRSLDPVATVRVDEVRLVDEPEDWISRESPPIARRHRRNGSEPRWASRELALNLSLNSGRLRLAKDERAHQHEAWLMQVPILGRCAWRHYGDTAPTLRHRFDRC
jgi:hypothetical protein